VRGDYGDIATSALLIAAPSDWRIYKAFRHIAAHWREHVVSEGLWLEHDIPIVADFTGSKVPAVLTKLFDGERTIVAKIELVLGSLHIEFIRSGGHPPFLQSFFDEIRLSLAGEQRFAEEELGHVVATLFRNLSIRAITAMPPFTRLFDVPAAKIVSVKHRLPRTSRTDTEASE
jgi:hypothetical protein